MDEEHKTRMLPGLSPNDHAATGRKNPPTDLNTGVMELIMLIKNAQICRHSCGQNGQMPTQLLPLFSISFTPRTDYLDNDLSTYLSIYLQYLLTVDDLSSSSSAVERLCRICMVQIQVRTHELD